MKLIEIKAQRNRIEAALTNTSEELSVGTTVLRHALDLIADPYSLYLDAAPDVRRLLNETFFECFYIDDLEDATVLRITDDKTVMFADRHSAAETTQIGRRINPGPTAAMHTCGRSLFRIKRFWWSQLVSNQRQNNLEQGHQVVKNSLYQAFPRSGQPADVGINTQLCAWILHVCCTPNRRRKCCLQRPEGVARPGAPSAASASCPPGASKPPT
jgi:hypothetical protein